VREFFETPVVALRSVAHIVVRFSSGSNFFKIHSFRTCEGFTYSKIGLVIGQDGKK
jgi:hypothetical protein